MTEIIKRDGRSLPFNREKIVNAVLAAFSEVDGEITDYARDKANHIAEYIESVSEEKQLTIEEIQDMVEHGLMSTRRKDVARAYIVYREKRDLDRKRNSRLMQDVSKKLMATDTKNWNANLDEKSFGGRMGEANSVLTKAVALDDIISEKSKFNHINNRIYIHDLNSYAVGMHNCLSLPMDKLLQNGFKTRQCDIRPANGVATACQLSAVIAQLQSLDQFGGVSATHIDWTMVPFIRKSFYRYWKDGCKYIERVQPEDLMNVEKWSIEDAVYKHYPKAYEYAMDMTTREVYQGVEALYHNLNTLQSRSGNQLPFTSINYGTCTLPEGRMFIRALLEKSIEGTGPHGDTSIFPCGIFQSSKEWNRYPGTPNYDLYQLALKSTSIRLYPNYANIDWSNNAGYDPSDPETYFSTMGCRTANLWDVNGFGQKKDGRGNICPVTIILPTLAMEAKEFCRVNYMSSPTMIKAAFFDILIRAIEDAKEMLLERFEWICSQNADSAEFMYKNGTMAGYVPEEGIRSALKHGTLAMGQIGLAETLQILIGCDHTTEKGMELAKDIEQLFKERCAYFKEEYSLNFGVYYTPAESLCYTAMTKFREKYGVIPKVSDRDYFTNSMHVPVWKEISPFDKIDIESQLTGYSSAGCITYVELDGGVRNNLEALEQIVNYAMEKDVPYFAINVPSDQCNNCGFKGHNGEIPEDECPECGGESVKRLRRVTGYLTGDYKSAFNYGKQKETEDRVKHGKGH